MPDQLTSLSLLDKIRQTNDEESWNRFTRIYQPFIRNWLARHLQSTSDIDDLVQDVLLTVFNKLKEFEHSHRPGAFRCWLRTTTMNRMKWMWRKQNLSPESDQNTFNSILDQLEDPHNDLSKQWEREHDLHVAQELLLEVQKQFAPATWQAFKRQVVDGVSALAISDELNLSVNAVLIAKSRVLKKLRELSLGILD